MFVNHCVFSFQFCTLSEQVWPFTSLTWLALLCFLWTCLSGLCELPRDLHEWLFLVLTWYDLLYL